MAKIFKKLSIGDTVASSGTRVFKKLSTEEPSLPIWNGVDLKGTAWVLRRGEDVSAEPGYGQFEVDIVYDGDFRKDAAAIYVGYTYPSYASLEKVTEWEDYITFVGTSGRDSDVWFFDLKPSGFSLEVILKFNGGTDATNPRLINWMINNADLVSHQPAHKGGLYDADDNLVASWDALVNTYGMNVEKYYLGQSYKTDPASPYNVLANNSELLAGTKIVISDKVTSIGIFAFGGCTALTSIVIPAGVGIAASAFFSCTSLTTVVIGDGNGDIPMSAFSNCTSLESIVIPVSVEQILLHAFVDCTSLTDVYYKGTEEQWNAIEIWGGNECLTNATIHYNSQ